MSHVGFCLTLVALLPLAGCAREDLPVSDQERPPRPSEAPPGDHFLCYLGPVNDSGEPPRAKANLKDQFDDAFVLFSSVDAQHFCNPVEKIFEEEVTEISNPDHHLVHYPLPEPLVELHPHITVLAGNQLSKEPQRMTLSHVQGLLVPVRKTRPHAHPEPEHLDHFKCYLVESGRAIGKTVTLTDELDTPYKDLLVGAPRLFCNPTEKEHDGVLTPIESPSNHLVCYQVALDVEADLEGETQFGDVVLYTSKLDWLCVPSSKQILPPETPPGALGGDDG